MINNLSVVVERLKVTSEHTAEAMGKMSTSIDRLVERLDKSDDTAREAMQSAKSAHHRLVEYKQRLDDVDRHYDGEVRAANERITKEVTALSDRLERQAEKRKTERNWIITTMIAVVGLGITIIKLF